MSYLKANKTVEALLVFATMNSSSNRLRLTIYSRWVHRICRKTVRSCPSCSTLLRNRTCNPFPLPVQTSKTSSARFCWISPRWSIRKSFRYRSSGHRNWNASKSVLRYPWLSVCRRKLQCIRKKNLF